VRELERRPREHAQRWTHLIGPRPEASAAASAPGMHTTPLSQPRPHPSAPVRPPEPPRPASPGADDVERLRDLVETLEQRVLSLEERLDRLEGR
jgi:uncharacterized protein YceH (UPF0502 family)